MAVTGAGRGGGRAYAIELVSRGARMVVNDVSAEHADELVSGLGKGAVASHGSIETVAGVEEVVEAARRRFGRLDAAVTKRALRATLIWRLSIRQISTA